MKESRVVMGMPATIKVVDAQVTAGDINQIYGYFEAIDERFSTYKESSEISLINAGKHPEENWSEEMRYVIQQCEETKQETQGYFDIAVGKVLDPSGFVKGWAIQNAALLLHKMGYKHYSVEIAGDIQIAGLNSEGVPWVLGIRNPFNHEEIIKRVSLSNMAIATSGTSARGQHIYNPHQLENPITDVISLSVIGTRIVDADRYATAAFAMGREGINFIATREGFEGYMVDSGGIATFTPGFNQYVLP